MLCATFLGESVDKVTRNVDEMLCYLQNAYAGEICTFYLISVLFFQIHIISNDCDMKCSRQPKGDLLLLCTLCFTTLQVLMVGLGDIGSGVGYW